MTTAPARACVIRELPTFPMGLPQSEPPSLLPSADEDESGLEDTTKAAQGERSMNQDLQTAGTDLHSISAEDLIGYEYACKRDSTSA
eukprot:249516-Rhodomonas_salina.1